MTSAQKEAGAFGLLALAVLVLFFAVPTYPGLDTYYHLVWGRELLDGLTPSFEGYRAPTHHPLWLAVGALASLAGEDGERLMVLVALLSLVAFIWAVYRLGSETLGTWPGIAAAVIVAVSFSFLLYAVRAFVDVPFLALVFWAAAVAARSRTTPWPPDVARPDAERASHRRRTLAMVLLAVAGLLRPEAWLLAGLWWLWCWRESSYEQRAGLAALVAAAPLVWVAVDLATTGEPFFSFTATSSLAEELRHEGGPGDVPVVFVTSLAGILRAPVLLIALIGVVLAVRRLGGRGAHARHPGSPESASLPSSGCPLLIPLTLVVAGSVTFAVTGLSGLSILPRYLTVPAAALALFAGYALLGWVGTTEQLWRRIATVTLVVGALGGVAFAVLSAGRVTGELTFVRDSRADLGRLLDDPRVRAGLRCGPLVLPTDRLVPDSRWLLDSGPESVYATTAPALGEWGGVKVVVSGDKAVDRFADAEGIPRATNRRPRGDFEPPVRSGRFTAYVPSFCVPIDARSR